nr:PREDICTED: uncharacterized protein LOC100562938 isoform X2 [Anolis carolinensis]|eukprot:XP_008104588.1 PREDICTED: uncharacterized protein LOC100562938 isoform X2 [Anolis carolinensis]
MRLANWKCSRIITSAATKISETCVAVATGTKSTRETWIAAKGASVFQSRHMNIWLRKQINCLINEGNNIKANVWDLQVTMRNMKAELKRIKHTEEKITYLEKEIETARKNHEEENITTSSEEQYLKKLEKDKENLHLRIFMLSEKRELQECKLICVEEDDVFTKMKHQIRELEEYIQEYQGKIQVLEDREKNLKKELSAIVKDKTQHRIKFQGRKNTERRKFCEEAALWWVRIAWIFKVLWHFVGFLLVILLLVFLVTLFILHFCLSNQTMTEAYHHSTWQIMGYYIQPYMEMHSSGILPN